MSATFHFAIPAGDLPITEKFYVEVLGCATGNREAGRWVDIDFWGNELTLHQSRIENSRFDYLQKPYRRFIGTEFEQETFFIEDPNGNILELKTLIDPDKIFGTE